MGCAVEELVEELVEVPVEPAAVAPGEDVPASQGASSQGPASAVMSQVNSPPQSATQNAMC